MAWDGQDSHVGLGLQVASGRAYILQENPEPVSLQARNNSGVHLVPLKQQPPSDAFPVVTISQQSLEVGLMIDPV